MTHRKQSRNKASTVGYLQLSYGDFSEARMSLRVALRPSHRTRHCGSIASFVSLQDIQLTLLELIHLPLLFYPFILGSDLSLPDRILPSCFRNWISGKKNPRMLEFQERFQNAKKNSSVMSQWHDDGSSGENIWLCLSRNITKSLRLSGLYHDGTDPGAQTQGRQPWLVAKTGLGTKCWRHVPCSDPRPELSAQRS